jgi:RNA polymerase sigma-54 factor
MALMQQLSPQQVLQASLLQLNLPLLEQRILHELEINPALELSDLSSDVNTEELAEEKNEAEEEIEFDWEELLGEHDDFEYPKTREKKDEEFETPIVHKDTFSERIMKQLQDYDMGKEELKISEQVLGNLDEQGYLNIEPSLISDRMGLDEEDVLKVMFKIQRLDTPGLATRNIQECLLVQAEVP